MGRKMVFCSSMNLEGVTVLKNWFQKHLEQELPQAHVVLGSGYGDALRDQTSIKTLSELSFDEVPGLKSATAPGHSGRYCLVRLAPKKAVLVQIGRLHGFEGYPARDVVQTVMLSRAAGIGTYFLTNAAGGIRREFNPGDAMVIRDHVNLTGQNPLVGEIPKNAEGADWGPRFPDLTVLYDRDLGSLLEKKLRANGLNTHVGKYLGLLGPSFETPAEIELFSQWGMDAVGMSTVWEAIALAHSKARVVGLSLISNVAAGLAGDQPIDHEVILKTCRGSAARIVVGIFQTLAALTQETGVK